MTETAPALLAVLGLVALTSAAGRFTAAKAAAAGGLLTLGGLCRPELLVWGALSMVFLLVFFSKGAPRRRGLAGAACAAVVVLGPWAVRNWIQFGRPILTTTHGGYTLLLGNNPQFYDYLRQGRWGETWNAEPFHEAWRERLLGSDPADELAADRLAYADVRQNIVRQPGMFLYASAVRVGRLWQLTPHRLAKHQTAAWTAARWAVTAWYALEFLLAVLGLWAVLARRLAGRHLLASLFCGALLAATFTAIHAVYWTNMRMRASLVPAIALAVAAGLAWLGPRIASHCHLAGGLARRVGTLRSHEISRRASPAAK